MNTAPADVAIPSVIRVADSDIDALRALLARYGLAGILVADHAEIPGSYWGECEAGMIGHCVYFRADTPVHSLLHEAAHLICMDTARREALHRDAGGDYDEENAVCYLQILLAEHVPDFGRTRMFADMDAWGYTFRLGSARAWFEQEADDARWWLQREGLLDAAQNITWRLRL